MCGIWARSKLRVQFSISCRMPEVGRGAPKTRGFNGARAFNVCEIFCAKPRALPALAHRVVKIRGAHIAGGPCAPSTGPPAGWAKPARARAWPRWLAHSEQRRKTGHAHCAAALYMRMCCAQCSAHYTTSGGYEFGPPPPTTMATPCG